MTWLEDVVAFLRMLDEEPLASTPSTRADAQTLLRRFDDDAVGTEPDIRELRLRYSVDGMVRLTTLVDVMTLGDLPEEIAMLLVHASNAANWHEAEAA